MLRGSLLCLAAVVAHANAYGDTRLLRYPDVHDQRLVFCYAGDLWTASAKGGTATRLTTHPGLELFPKFSPDGKTIAFTGQYDGDEQVYVIPSEGGIPKQLTYYPASGPLPDRWGYDNQVYGWTVDGGSVLFRSMRAGWDLSDTRLFTVPVSGGLPTALPMRVAGGGDFSPDGTRVAFSPLTRDFRTWKRYEGGWAQDLYIFDLNTSTSRRITEHPRTDRDPMWIGDRVYFASDRDGTLNLYHYDTKTGATGQATRSTEFDVRWPSKGDAGQIVYELGGQLHVLDTTSGESALAEIHVPTDGLAMRSRRVAVGGQVSSMALSPGGKRALFSARGDIFTVPVEHGPTRNLTRSSGVHDKWPSWSPSGDKIAYISDATGEEELYMIDAKGEGEPERLTEGGTVMRYSPSWSPDGKRIAFGDKNGRLFVIEVATRKVIEVADDPAGQISDNMWSPDGGHVAFSMSDENGFSSIYIWSVEDGQRRRITGEMFNEFEPVWDPDGKYLFYFSDRQFAPQIGTVEWNYVRNRETGIYAVALRKDVGPALPPRNDEPPIKTPDKDTAAGEGEKQPGESGQDPGASKKAADDEKGEEARKDEPDSKRVKIDFDGMADRVARLPVEDDNYVNLMAVKDHLLFVRSTPFFYGRSPGVAPEIRIFSFKDRTATTLVEGAGGYTLAPDGSKVLVQADGGYATYDPSPAGKGSRKAISTSGMFADVEPTEEWEQIFHEVWRRYRDFFYVDNMHGYDWQSLRDQYRPLLKHVAHRSDLNYVIGEMIAELNVGHAYKAGGDYEVPRRAPVALPGARFELDAESGRYRIQEIYRGHNEEPIYRSPLTEVGVDIQVGDYVLAIDGEDLKGSDNPYRLLRHKAGGRVTFSVNSKPETAGAREVSFQPVTSEDDLLYLNWVEKNRRMVAERTGGRVGYLHLPNMSAEGIREFNKWYYGQIRKDGLIIDVRNNGGGNVSQMVILRLTRQLLATRFSRNNDFAGTYPNTVFTGHLVCLLNENSASDGDIFPAMFREAGLGPLIGKRSWGGVTGITNRGTLIDGGTVFVPEFGFASKDGRWIIEGYGVDPDIEVDNDPTSLVQGRDPQLERGIKEVTDRMGAEPRPLPPRPAAPIKTK